MDVAFPKNSNNMFVLNLIACFFFSSFVLLLLVAYNKFVIMFFCMFPCLMHVSSVGGKFNDDRNLICFVHHCVPPVSHRAWQEIGP